MLELGLKFGASPPGAEEGAFSNFVALFFPPQPHPFLNLSLALRSVLIFLAQRMNIRKPAAQTRSVGLDKKGPSHNYFPSAVPAGIGIRKSPSLVMCSAGERGEKSAMGKNHVWRNEEKI